ncbi:MAG: DUF4388 domain-containing protein [Deltaproteobacteria bacterium]|nr:MAG: DUF4388 domain-containing protein [Deltaproteobacteria bacterium]
MALKGTLKDFGIADIFQLISHQQKSGILTLAGKDKQVQIGFEKGMVIMAKPGSRDKKDQLGKLLVRSGLVTQEQLEEALETQKHTLQKIGDILIENGILSKQDLGKALLLQTQETVFKLINWHDGIYEFHPQKVSYEKDLYTPLSCEHLLMEGYRILDEWPGIKKFVPSFDMIFRQKSDPSSGENSVPSLSEEEKMVFDLIDGKRSVEDIIHLSHLGEFDACKALATLIRVEQIEQIQAEKEETPIEKTGEKPKANIIDYLLNTLSFVFLVGAIIFIVIYSNLNPLKQRYPSGRQPVKTGYPQIYLGKSQWERIKYSLEIYRLENGNYPESLEELVNKKLLKPKELSYPWNERYYYQREGDDYLLLEPKR